MIRLINFLILGVAFNLTFAQNPVKISAIEEVDRLSPELINLSQQIWELAEPSFQERNSAELIRQRLSEAGFIVTDNAGGLPTQFVAEYGSDGPLIGLFGEYDADQGASNKVVTFREPRTHPHGHGGHHNLLGVGSLGTALALKQLISKGMLDCRLIYYGTTDEGGLGGKTFLAQEGFFNELDFSIYWHPSPVTGAMTHGWDSMFELEIVISSPGKKNLKHDPRNSDPLLFFEETKRKIDSTRQAINPEIRINYSIEVQNSDLRYYADSVAINLLFQHHNQKQNALLYDKISHLLAQPAPFRISASLKRSHHAFITNYSALRAIDQNIRSLDPLSYATEETRFVEEFFSHHKKEGALLSEPLPIRENPESSIYGYSSDIGEASWFAPEAYLVITTLPRGARMHHWEGSIFSGHSIGHKGMIYAAKVMAMTIIDYIQNDSLRNAIHKEFQSKTKDYVYRNFR